MAHGRRRGISGVKILVGLVILGALGTLGVIWASSGGASTTNTNSLELASAEIRDFEITASASGELVARNSVELKSPLERTSTVTYVIPEGTTVERGVPLIRLNVEDLMQQLREEELQVISAKNELDQAESAVRIQISENASRLMDAQLQVALAELALRRWQEGEVAQQRERNRISVENAERNLKRLSEKVERSRELFQKEFLSKDELEQDEIALAQAQADVVITKLEREIHETFRLPEEEKTKMSEVEKAKAALERTVEQNEINLRDKQAAVETRAQRLRVREENFAKLERQIRDAEIIAPRAGLVVYASSMENNRGGWGGDVPISVGRDVRPNETLIILPDVSEMVASVRIHESLAGRVREGQAASVHIEAVGRTIDGVVESVGVLAATGGWRDPNRREYTVRILLDMNQAADAGLKPSMRCDAKITINNVRRALSVPIQAVFVDGPVQFVYVPNGPRFDRIPVRMGRRSDAYAEIAMGLTEGQRVLLRTPSPAEVLDTQWTEAQLAAAGYALDEDGKPVIAMPAGMAMGRPPGAAAGPDAARANGNPNQRRQMVAPPSGDGRPQGEPSGSRTDRPTGQEAQAAVADASPAKPKDGSETAETASVKPSEGKAAEATHTEN
ncbi:MAG: hypothetical protein KIT24_07155 [Phycisphaeraceae bacterium]|nr:hypothetical protein [Phycisphaeraceae bacterium]